MVTDPIRDLPICIVGGNKLFRLAFKTLLEEIHVKVVEEFDAIENVSNANDNRAQDIQLVVCNASVYADELAEQLLSLKKRFHDTPVILISDAIQPHMLRACIAAGINGYLSQSISLEALQHSLRLAALGEKIFPSNFSDLRPDSSGGSFIEHSNDNPPVRQLSLREREILSCLADGNSNKAIARQLGITEATVKVHMKNLLRKIDAVNRTQAALWAVKNKVTKAIYLAAAIAVSCFILNTSSAAPVMFQGLVSPACAKERPQMNEAQSESMPSD
jgi:two-component system nitrate/nitrite response regulator NarL